MKQNKEIKREVKKQSSERKYKRDADGRVIINMTVKDDTDFLSVFSTGDTPVISSEVAEFLENKYCQGCRLARKADNGFSVCDDGDPCCLV